MYCFEASIALIDPQKNPLGVTTGIFDLRSEPFLSLPCEHQPHDDAAELTKPVLVDIRLENLDATSLRGVFSVLQVPVPLSHLQLKFYKNIGASYAA